MARAYRNDAPMTPVQIGFFAARVKAIRSMRSSSFFGVTMIFGMSPYAPEFLLQHKEDV